MRKLLLVSMTAAIAVMAVSASAAQAFVVRDQATYAPCSNVTMTGSSVTGGCLVENMYGTLNIAYGQTTHYSCYASFDMHIQANGHHWIVNQYVNCNWSDSVQACEDANGELKPWVTGPDPSKSPICLAPSDNPTQETSAPIDWGFDIGPNGELWRMYQTNNTNWVGVGNASFTNGDDSSIVVTAS